jgi:hypothetical protein|tara:strand:+ start:36 stop:296 length:261 start_codon:yes stop_codon:yes gene_type:complete
MPWLMNLAWSLPSLASDVQDILDAVVDESGRVDPGDAEAAGRLLSDELGDVLRVRVGGVDIIGPDAQADLFAFLARVSARAHNTRR